MKPGTSVFVKAWKPAIGEHFFAVVKPLADVGAELARRRRQRGCRVRQGTGPVCSGRAVSTHPRRAAEAQADDYGRHVHLRRGDWE